ncbi:MAG: putative bifunctional diguanylate cyclase/phosphodiesterase [Actinomycetota bacterium]
MVVPPILPPGRASIVRLVVVLAGACIAVAATAFVVLWDVFLEGQKARLTDAVRAEARAIGSMAEHEKSDISDPYWRERAIARVVLASRAFPGFGDTGEFTFGAREGDRIVFYLRHRHRDGAEPLPVPWDSGLASPMRAALDGRSGTIIGSDYRGAEVLAAFEPIPELGMGLVAKIDMAEVRRPFRFAGLAAAGVGAVVIAIGAMLLFSIGSPMVARIESSESRYRELFEHMRSAVLVLVPAGDGADDFVVTDCNEALLATEGLSRSEVVGRSLVAVFPAAADCGLLGGLRRVMADGLPHKLPMSFYQDSRISGWREHTLFRLPSGEVVDIYDDVTARKRAESGLQMAQAVFQHTGEGIVVTDPQGRIERVNPAFTAITGYDAVEAVGNTPAMLKSDHQPPEFYVAMWAALKQNGAWQGEIWNRRKNGEAYLEWLTINAVLDEHGQVAHYVAVFDDISELHAKDQHIRHQAFHDALTGLPNRSLLIDRLDHAVAAAARGDRKVAVMFIDLDHFKVVNDSLGHDVGDELLKAFAQRIKDGMRKSDTLARLGGDEFVVLATDWANPADLATMAEKILEMLGRPFTIAGHEMRATASIGIALHPADGGDSRTLMKSADVAMYAVKESGRAGYRFFDAGMDRQAMERLTLESALRRAIDEEQFEVHYQPKISLCEQRMAGMEALVRWRHPEHGMISPVRFIPLAEETGLVVPLGEWVLRQCCRQAAAWRAAGFDPGHIAVNVSARQLVLPDFADRVAAIMADEGVPPEAIDLEITETAVMREPERAAEILADLRARGVRIVLDDFGVGYSSLGYLKRLPIAVLKMDRSFIHDVAEDPGSAALAKAIIDLAHALAIEVVAEGVETEAQLKFLSESRCCMVQGYIYARPMPAIEVEQRFLAAAVPA